MAASPFRGLAEDGADVIENKVEKLGALIMQQERIKKQSLGLQPANLNPPIVTHNLPQSALLQQKSQHILLDYVLETAQVASAEGLREKHREPMIVGPVTDLDEWLSIKL
jgi:hypothetical protein